MRDPANRVQVLRDLRFALEVMEERSHIGLDDKSARIVRKALLNRILETEKGHLYPRSAEKAMGEPTAEESLTA